MRKNIKGIVKKIGAATLCGTLILGAVSMTGCGSKEVAKDYKKQTAKEGKLVVGLDDTFAPMGFRDKDGNLIGFDIDLAKEVGKKLGMEVEFKPISWDAKDLELKSKKIDCIWNGMSVTPERKEKMSLSKKYLDNKIILMTSKGKKIDIKSDGDLKKYKIGTQTDSAALETLKKNKEYDSFKDKVTEYPDYDKALLALKGGKIDVIAIDQVLGEYKNKNLKGELATLDFSLGDDAYAIGFRKGDTALRDKVNEALETLVKEGKAEEISKKWFNKNIVILKDN